MDPVTILGLLGVIVTLYAIYVEQTAKPGVQNAACDAGPGMSCTTALTSPYARLAKLYLGVPRKSVFNMPNTYYGLMFYVAVILYTIYPFTLIPLKEFMLLFASFGSILLSIFLAGILYFKLKTFCAVCCVSWIINFGIFYNAYLQVLTYF
jgi:vitamin-K-epoxide reductase (warfarin-sensitive)